MTFEEKYEYLKDLVSKDNDEICQLIGKTLEYPWFKDDQKNFPGATEEHGVCVGDHVYITMVYELVEAYKSLKTQCELQSTDNEKLRQEIKNIKSQSTGKDICN